MQVNLTFCKFRHWISHSNLLIDLITNQWATIATKKSSRVLLLYSNNHLWGGLYPALPYIKVCRFWHMLLGIFILIFNFRPLACRFLFFVSIWWSGAIWRIEVPASAELIRGWSAEAGVLSEARGGDVLCTDKGWHTWGARALVEGVWNTGGGWQTGQTILSLYSWIENVCNVSWWNIFLVLCLN